MGEKNSKTNKTELMTGITLVCISVVVLGIVLMQTITGDVWYDELFSVSFAKMSVRDIISMTAKDVHPPLYYFYLKLVTCIFTGAAYVIAAKVASAVPYIALMILSLTVIRKKYGMTVSGLFCLLISVMPNMATFYVEIRMYSFALLWITVAYLQLINIVKDNKCSNWVLMFVAGIFTAYTQYFACVAIIALYLYLLIYSYVIKNKQYIKRILLVIVGSIVLYMPWIPVLISQMKNVVGGYWIQPMSLRSIPGCIKYIFLPVAPYGKILYVSAALMIIMTLIAVGLGIYHHHKKEEMAEQLSGYATLVLMVIVGFVCTIIGRPIFVYRYMIPAMGAMLLGISISVVYAEDKRVLYGFVAATLFIGFFSIKGFYLEEHKKVEQFPHAEELLAQIDDDSIIITNFEQVTALAAYYKPEAKIYIYGQFVTDPYIKTLFDGHVYESGGMDIAKLVEDSDVPVYYLGSGQVREEIVANWKDNGINTTYIDECLLERYWFNVYKVELDGKN